MVASLINIIIIIIASVFRSREAGSKKMIPEKSSLFDKSALAHQPTFERKDDSGLALSREHPGLKPLGRPS